MYTCRVYGDEIVNELIDEYLKNGTGNENSNENFSNSGLQSYIAGKILAEDYTTASPLRDLHKKRLVHVHDARGGRFLPYCCGLSLSKLLTLGLANPTGSSSKPAKHFDTAMSHLGNMLGISQQEFSGAQAFSSVDTYLSAFISYDELNYKEVKQAWQQVIYDLNFPRREGYQTIFCNLSFDLKCPDHLKDEHVIRGGELQPETYSQFQPEMDMFNMAFLEVMLEGDRHCKPFSFPIPTYYIVEDMDWDSPVVNRIFELTAKFGLPYFSNSVGTGRSPNEVRAQCCRLSLDMIEIQQLFDTLGRGIWDIGESTGSIAVTTINMGQVGYHCSDLSDSKLGTVFDDYDAAKETAVINMVDDLLQKIKEHHVWKRADVEWGLANGLFPFTRNYIANFITYFSTVCVVGMNEGCFNLFGKPIHECEDFVVNVLTHIRERLWEFCVETGFLWNLEEAPAEGISHSLAIWDRDHYDSYVQGSGDGVYYTNSTHCAVDSGISIFDEIHCQEKFKRIYNGGTLQHLFVGEGMPDPMGVKDLIRNICTNTSLPYIAFTKSYAICDGCGMSDDLSGTCPKCGDVTDVFSRVTGYYRSTRKYSTGKQAEFKARKQHNVGEFSR